MNNFIYRLKHWQIFLIIFGPIAILYYFMMRRMFALISEISYDPGMAEDMDPTEFMDGMFSYLPIMLLFYLLIYLWYWAVGVGLQQKIPQELRQNTSLFKVLLFIPILFLFFYIYAFSNMMESMMAFEEGEIPDMSMFSSMMFGSLITFGISMYLVYFTAKTLKTAYKQERQDVGDFIGEFFLILFFPIGIWILQPMINKIIEEEEDLLDEV